MAKCNKCGKEVKNNFEFCPYCGNRLDNSNNWGMLGKGDNFFEDPFENSFFGGGILNKMIGNAMKMLEREFQGVSKEKVPNTPRTNLQLYINGKRINLGGNEQSKKVFKKSETKKQNKGIPSIYFSKEDSKKFSNLEKENPKTSVRRLSDRIIYDIEMPEVKSVKDISIINLENSIEIKAIGKSKAYYKVINIGLPIRDYYLDKGKLVLELGMKN